MAEDNQTAEKRSTRIDQQRFIAYRVAPTKLPVKVPLPAPPGRRVLVTPPTARYALGMKPGRKWWIMWGCLLIPVFAVLAFICMAVLNVFHAHEHCIKQAGLDHEGRLPCDTNGFGNALLLLMKGGYLGDTDGVYSIGPITGPGDKGEIFKRALKTGERIPEDRCSRIYIQGLSETNDPQIAILFDKKSCPGADHFRRPWGPLERSRSAGRNLPATRWNYWSRRGFRGQPPKITTIRHKPPPHLGLPVQLCGSMRWRTCIPRPSRKSGL
jgi:hypothetical protein